LPTGANPNSGTVAPKIATTGVRMATAMCIGELSFVTATRQRRISSADWSTVNAPIALSTV